MHTHCGKVESEVLRISFTTLNFLRLGGICCGTVTMQKLFFFRNSLSHYFFPQQKYKCLSVYVIMVVYITFLFIRILLWFTNCHNSTITNYPYLSRIEIIVTHIPDLNRDELSNSLQTEMVNREGQNTYYLKVKTNTSMSYLFQKWLITLSLYRHHHG